MGSLMKIYNAMLWAYGPQGWWPIVSLEKGKSEYGVDAPRDEADVFEICTGAILTQNTAWKNVEKALLNLKVSGSLDPKKISGIRVDKLSAMIRPAGYFNQKAKKLKLFSEFYIGLNGKAPSREELLSVWGIGPETADSILLYAYRKPFFVVDAYTRRIFAYLGLVKEDSSYDDIQKLFMDNLKHDERVFNEYHALIVDHAKRHYQKRPYGQGCFLRKVIG